MSVNFAELKASVSIERVCEMLGVKLKAEPNGQLRGICPIHGGDNARGFVVTPSKQLWYCFKACGGGDIIKLVEKVRGLPTKEAAEWIAAGGNSTPTVKLVTKPARDSATVTKPCPQLDYLQPAHEAVQALGVSVETAEAWESGWASKGILRGFYAVPVRNLTGDRVAYVGIGQDGALRFYSGFDPSTALFGQERVVEGTNVSLLATPLAVILASQNGVEGAVSFLTPTISARQVEQLAVLLDEKQCELELP